jgi:hypothetical protein
MPKMDEQRLIDLADAVLDGAGAAGGLDEIERIADDGWPEDAPLTNDSPELRVLIQERAQEILDEENENDEDEDDDIDEDEEEEK